MPIAASAWIHRDGLRTSATECALLKVESHHRFGGFRCRDSNHHNSTLWQHAIVRRDRANMGSWRSCWGCPVISVVAGRNARFKKASGLSSFGFGGTNAHVTCKSSEEVVETKAGQLTKPRHVVVW